MNNSTEMNQGYSGSILRREGDLVEKVSSDQVFMESKERQKYLISLSRKIAVLPRIDHIDNQAIYMEYVDGRDALHEQNAHGAGKALRLLHDQKDYYPFHSMTGVKWLMELANDNLTRTDHRERFSTAIESEYPCDALIHSEPDQFIERNDGAIVFIDFEGIGMGSRYHDLGYIHYATTRDRKPEVYKKFMEGYQTKPIKIEQKRVKRIAGIISIAYAQFADFEERIELGFRLLSEAGS